MQLFAAIDFETSSSERNSACALGYVIFNHSKIIKKQSYLKIDYSNNYADLWGH